jgi:hypothetical protein
MATVSRIATCCKGFSCLRPHFLFMLERSHLYTTKALSSRRSHPHDEFRLLTARKFMLYIPPGKRFLNCPTA